jgi:hypothetical protein
MGGWLPALAMWHQTSEHGCRGQALTGGWFSPGALMMCTKWVDGCLLACPDVYCNVAEVKDTHMYVQRSMQTYRFQSITDVT